MKTMSKTVEVALCEVCGAELGIVSARYGTDRYTEIYSCVGCGRWICDVCAVGEYFSYNLARLRLCGDCLNKMTVVDLIQKLKK